MKINKDNYEAYFLDFIEGNLRPSAKRELDLFLHENPELKEELNDFDWHELEEDSTSNELLKSKLRKEESTQLSEWDYLLIAELEGVLSEQEKKKLAELRISDSSQDEDTIGYAKTKLPLESLSFEHKQKLKKQGRLVYFVRYAAAAAVLLAFFYLVNSKPEANYKPRFADNKLQEQQLEQKPLQMDGVVVLDSETDNQDRSVPENHEMPKAQLASNSADVPKQIEEGNKEPSVPELNLDAGELQTAENTGIDERESQKDSTSIVQDFPEANLVAQVDDEAIRTANAKKEDYLAIDELAKKKIKEDLLKNKTLSETIADEIKSISKDKLSFTQSKNEQGKTELIAFNIGKFKFSRKQ